MTNPTPTPTISPSFVARSTMPVQVALAAAWTTFMFLYVYVDVLNFYKPGVVAGILDGMVWRFDVTAPLLTTFLVSVSIPALMVFLSVVLPRRANRMTNLVVAALLIPYSIFNAAGAAPEWIAFYVISIGIEVALLLFVLSASWRWRAIPVSSAPTRIAS